MIFFTADLHLGHENIIKFCKRPFKNIQHMNARLIANWNERVNANDTVYHIGDFAYKTGQQGMHIDPLMYESQLNGKIIHILGNHDRNNHLRNSIYYAEIQFGKRKWALQHHPPALPLPNLIYLVGHVHERWRYKVVNNVLIVNVGVDQWNFYPIKLPQLLRQVAWAKKHKEDFTS